MATIFRKISDSDAAAMQLALKFYAPMYLLYSIYDGAEDGDTYRWIYCADGIIIYFSE